MSRDKLDNIAGISHRRRDHIPEMQKRHGEITGLFPIYFPEYRMIVFIADKAKEAECRKKWAEYHGNKFRR